jgi:hypothetical protein
VTYIVIAIVILAIIGNPWVMKHYVAAYKNWRARRADAIAIKDALKFMGAWRVYDLKKAEEDPLPAGAFAQKVEDLKRRVRAESVHLQSINGHQTDMPDPYAFDKAIRELVNGPDTTEPVDDQDSAIIARGAKHLAAWNR